MRFQRPSPTTAIALVALLLAAGGGDAIAGGTAAAVKAISGKKIKKNSIEANRLTAKARRTLKGQAGAAGPTGPAGATGAAGPAGATGPTGSVDTSNFYDKTTSDDRFLLATGKAVDADRLDGLDSSAFLAAGAKAADAETVDGIDGAAIAKRGIVQVVLDARGWEPFSSGDPLTYTRFNESFRMSRSGTGSNLVVMPAVLPNAVNGERLRLVSVRYCYTASVNVPLALFQVNMISHTSGGTGSSIGFSSDTTDRTDAACRTLAVSSPAELNGTVAPAILAQFDWNVANENVSLGAVTLNLAATTSAATDPSK